MTIVLGLATDLVRGQGRRGVMREERHRIAQGRAKGELGPHAMTAGCEEGEAGSEEEVAKEERPTGGFAE